ncbi:hypothetical protein ACU6ZE_06900 [Klebsiella aerogenes]
MTNNQLTDHKLTKIIESAEAVISALAGHNDDVHPDDSTKMCRLWDALNDDDATPEVVLVMAKELQERRKADSEPAPVVPEKCPAEIRDLISSHSDALFNDDDAQEIWNACRAAMLQTGNSPVIPDGYVMVPKEPTAEMQSAGASAIRIETTALNKLWTGNAVFRAMLAAAPQEVKP